MKKFILFLLVFFNSFCFSENRYIIKPPNVKLFSEIDGILSEWQAIYKSQLDLRGEVDETLLFKDKYVFGQIILVLHYWSFDRLDYYYVITSISKKTKNIVAMYLVEASKEYKHNGQVERLGRWGDDDFPCRILTKRQALDCFKHFNRKYSNKKYIIDSYKAIQLPFRGRSSLTRWWWAFFVHNKNGEKSVFLINPWRFINQRRKDYLTFGLGDNTNLVDDVNNDDTKYRIYQVIGKDNIDFMINGEKTIKLCLEKKITKKEYWKYFRTHLKSMKWVPVL